MLRQALLTTCMRQACRRHMSMRRVEGPFRPAIGRRRPRLMYIHIPFCVTLCPYCSFHRVRYEPELAARYFRSLRREVELYRDSGFDFDAVYVGGGTPTVEPLELASLLGFIRDIWPIRTLSVESHPRDLTPEAIAALKGAGVARLSVGVQTFNDNLLGKLGRAESHGGGGEARAKLLRVRDEFDTVNVDLIYNLPGQTLDMALEDVETIRRLGMNQVTFYPLMDDGEGFLETVGKADAGRERRFFREIVSALAKAAYEPVTAWCFSSKPGTADEYIVAHDEYAGLGSGAFSYVQGVFYANTFDVRDYMARLRGAQFPVVAARTFDPAARIRYEALMRLFGGSLDLSQLAARYGRNAPRSLWKEILFLRLTGAVVRRGPIYRLTPRGRGCLAGMMKEFFMAVGRVRRWLNSPDAR